MTRGKAQTAGRLTAGQVSARVLYALVAVIVAVFGAFFFVGYDVPFEDNPEFNAPLLTDLVLVFIYALTGATALLTVAAIGAGVRNRDKERATANNIPAALIARGTAALLVASMAATFLLGSTEPVAVNGEAYADAFWLRTTDMFINTSIVLLMVAAAGVAFGLSGKSRNLRIKR